MMTTAEFSKISARVMNYDIDAARGITHDRDYTIKIDQYRIVLSGQPGG